MLQRKICASFVVILTLAATPVLAQQPEHEQNHPAAAPNKVMSQGMPGGAGGMPMMGPGGGMMGGDGFSRGMWRMMMGEGGISGMGMMSATAGHVEGRLAFLKTELKITNAQLPLWNKFADALRNNARTAGKVIQGSAASFSQSATVPDRLAAREKLLTAQLDTLRNLKAVVDPLYDALSAEQKKTADEVMLAPIGVMM
jgi:hypothetical protein